MLLSNAHSFALGFMILIGLVFVGASYLMLTELRTNYPDIYNEVGRPAFFAPRSIIEQWRFVRFIVWRKYDSLASKKIRILGDIILLCSASNLAIILYLGVTGFRLSGGDTGY
jgi:hypothetical protein